ncbi:hypothetical protein FZEAL_1785 [Fusarium zealandicum]|uniref:Uncharacterized protein n=1 Tax=Fusarium zealandicum TaxID=1053134 RepID=A0A8H4XP70_9HYPO|nr:hypothetical protein FZEAL_1785 [Fusarium zealandicum]
MASTGKFRLCIPVDEDPDPDRITIDLEIQSVSSWRLRLGLDKSEAGSTRPRYHEWRPENLDKDGWPMAGWRNRPPRLPLRVVGAESPPKSKTSTDPGDRDSPKSNRSSATSSPAYTLRECELCSRIDDSGAVDAEALEQRLQTLKILEGKLVPPPNRHYSGPLEQEFRSMARNEIRAKRERAEAARFLHNSRLTRASPGGLQGWKFLRDIMIDGLTDADAVRFPAWHPKQRAYLIIEDRKGVGRKIRNLDACSKNELLKLMQQAQDNGWQDVIWVANPDEDIPYRYPDKDEIYEKAEMIWGGVRSADGLSGTTSE